MDAWKSPWRIHVQRQRLGRKLWGCKGHGAYVRASPEYSVRIPSGGFIGVFAVCVVSGVAVVFCYESQLGHSHTPIAGRVTGNQGDCCEGSSSLAPISLFVWKDGAAYTYPEEALLTRPLKVSSTPGHRLRLCSTK